MELIEEIFSQWRTPEHPKALNRFQRRRKRGNLEIHTAADRSRYDNGSKLGQSGQYRG